MVVTRRYSARGGHEGLHRASQATTQGRAQKDRKRESAQASEQEGAEDTGEWCEHCIEWDRDDSVAFGRSTWEQGFGTNGPLGSA